MNSELLRIGNAQGFWGDSVGAPSRLMAQQPDLDYLTMDYLAEVSMSILAVQREKNPELGYAVDFIEELRSLTPFWKKGSKCKVVANAGGLNPEACGKAAVEALNSEQCGHLKVAVVTGDDVLDHLLSDGEYPNLDTGDDLRPMRSSLISANAYLGAKPIVEALQKGADIVITGRVADPSMTVACCVVYFGWDWSDLNRLAQATVAGHLIECGTQVTGGISTNWLDIADPVDIGFPIIEMEEDGAFVVTKPTGTGGVVNEQTVKEQLLYEIGDPDNYMSPDVVVSFLSLALQEDGENRIKVTGAKGKSSPSTLKVSATYRNGFRAEGMLTLFGRHVREKAHRCGKAVLQRVKNAGYDLEQTHIECIGAGEVVPGVVPPTPEWELHEGMLRICVADPRKQAVECFAKEIAPLITSGAQGMTGYFGGRPKVRSIFGFWPCLIDSNKVTPKVKMIGGKPS